MTFRDHVEFDLMHEFGEVSLSRARALSPSPVFPNNALSPPWLQGYFFDFHVDTKPNDGTLRTVNVNVMLSPRDAYEGGTLQVLHALLHTLLSKFISHLRCT